jgi:hypothetical protein
MNLGPGLLSMSPQFSIDFLSWNVYSGMRFLVLSRGGVFLMFGSIYLFFPFLLFSRMLLISLIFLFFCLVFKQWCVSFVLVVVLSNTFVIAFLFWFCIVGDHGLCL